MVVEFGRIEVAEPRIQRCVQQPLFKLEITMDHFLEDMSNISSPRLDVGSHTVPEPGESGALAGRSLIRISMLAVLRFACSGSASDFRSANGRESSS